MPVGFVVDPYGQVTLPVLIGQGKAWQVPGDKIQAKWWADHANYEGTWNTSMQGG